jgi:hypothetical protein
MYAAMIHPVEFSLRERAKQIQQGDDDAQRRLSPAKFRHGGEMDFL